MQGLRRLEYRGYDSAGVAVIGDSGELRTAKKAGRIENLDAELERLADFEGVSLAGQTGIGHTRWATHGAPNDVNAHPHVDTGRRIAVVHNGIIENFSELRAGLEAAGVELVSETDTETVAHLVAAELAAGAPDLTEATRRVCCRLQGAFTLVLADREHPETVVGARRNSPLVLGLGEDENFLGSDVAAFISYTKEAVELGQDQLVEISRDGYRILHFDGTPAEGKRFTIDWDLAAAEKGGYDYFMLKEIQEQPTAVADTLRAHYLDGRIALDEQRLDSSVLREIDKVFVVACGTAYHAGLLAKHAIEHWTRIPVEVEMASEFRYRDPVLDQQTLVVAISQSGETADTLEAVRHAKEQRATRAGDLQHQRRPDPARGRRGALHPRRPRDRGGGHQDLQRPGRGGADPGPGAGPGPRHHVRRRGRRGVRLAAGDAGPDRRHPDRRSSRSGCWPARSPGPRRCCSSAGTSATRWPWRARSSSRSWPTCTPRASRPASSSTGRSR